VKLTWINLYSLPDETPSLVDWDGLSLSASPRLTPVFETARFLFSPIHGYQSFFFHDCFKLFYCCRLVFDLSFQIICVCITLIACHETLKSREWINTWPWMNKFPPLGFTWTSIFTAFFVSWSGSIKWRDTRTGIRFSSIGELIKGCACAWLLTVLVFMLHAWEVLWWRASGNAASASVRASGALWSCTRCGIVEESLVPRDMEWNAMAL
jgi:hypothetical protein